MIVSGRRSFLTGLGALLITAPAIVRAGSLMPVKQMIWNADDISALLDARLDQYEGEFEPRLFTRYSGYEVISFDPDNRTWRTEQQYSKLALREAKGELEKILNG